MTNMTGLEILFVMLGLFVACLIVTALLGVAIAWNRWGNDELGHRASQIRTVVAVGAIGLSILSWGLALVFITPAGIVERVGPENPVLIGLLLGFTAPAVIGGYILQSLRSREANHHTA